MQVLSVNRYVDTADTAEVHPGGQFLIGGTNASLYTGDINYVDVIQPAKWWLIPIESAGTEGGPAVPAGEGYVSVLHRLRGLTCRDSKQNAIIDTGTTLVGGEDVVLDAIYANITGAVKAGDLSIRLNGFWALRMYPLKYLLSLLTSTSM